MTENFKIINEWVKFGRNLIMDENPDREPMHWDIWNKFGIVMLVLRGNGEFPLPSGSECRDWARAFDFFYNGTYRGIYGEPLENGDETPDTPLTLKFDDMRWAMDRLFYEKPNFLKTPFYMNF